MKYGKILVPTDGSEVAKNALKHASGIADEYDAELHSIYVIDTGISTEKKQVSELMSQLENSGKLEKTGRETLENARKIVDRDLETNILSGKPHREIRKYVDGEEIDLVIMGTHGRSGLDRMLLGSVTEKVLRSVDVPVMTVPER